MPTLLAQIAPQRSTQYAALASDLAPHELRLSALGNIIEHVETLTLAGQAYLKIELSSKLDEAHLHELSLLATTSVYFAYYDHIGDHNGPFLRPLDATFKPALPADLITTRRYRGKTNELFTHFLCNVARASSAFHKQPWSTLRVFDPLAGGGTTLFTALVLGADATGVEQNVQDASSTASFLKRYLNEQGIGCQLKEERLKKLGKRWQATIGRAKSGNAQHFALAHGDTTQSAALLTGLRPPHLIVGDLPYGVQHQGQLVDLLTAALPVWSSLLMRGGAMALSWDATRFPREEMVALVESIDESSSGLTVLNEPPYDALSHRVDRVIKKRDVVVASQL